MLLPIMLYVSIVPPDIKESFISLRDAEFVGEDKRLKSLLAQRMAVLQSPVNMTGADEPSSLERIVRRAVRPLDDGPLLKPDFLDFKHISKIPNNVRFNVSMDYAELVNVSDLPVVPSPPDADVLNFTGDARRALPLFYYAKLKDVNLKVLNLMQQNVYMVQSRLRDIEPLIKMNEHDVRFRIAYILNRIEEWLKDLRTIYHAMIVPRYWPYWRVKKLLIYYEYALRKNIDITYSVELVIYLHTAYMGKMDEIAPKSQVEQMHQAKEMQQQMGRRNESAVASKEDVYGPQPRVRLPRL